MTCSDKQKSIGIKAVFLDIDGTVLSHSQLKVPQSAVSAIAKIRDQGIRVIACTGRHSAEMKHLPLDDITFDGYVTVNGALCYGSDGIWYGKPIDPSDVRILLEDHERDPYPCLFMEEDLVYIGLTDDEAQIDKDAFHTPVPEKTDLRRALSHPVYMIVPYIKEERWKTAALQHARVSCWSRALDVFHEDAGKASGMKHVMERFGWKKEEVLAVGDGPNDIEMAEAAGYFAAMGNATEATKRAACFVSSDIDDDGLEKVFEQFGLL